MRRCPHCGYSIYDKEIVFCPSCKGLIDKHLNLINDIDKLLYQYHKDENKTPLPQKEQPKTEVQKIQSNDEVIKREKKKEKNNIIYVYMILIFVVLIAIFIFLR